MALSKTTRRQLLKAGLGAGAFALIEKLGIPLVSPRIARADPGYGPGSGKPTKILTIYVPGGWSAQHAWCPLSAQQIGGVDGQSGVIPNFENPYGNQYTQFYNADQVMNADGTGDALGPDGFQRLRTPRVFDEEGLLSKQLWIEKQTAGFAWTQPDWAIYNRVNVVHGVATETAAHHSARIGMLSGIPNANFIVPSLHARVAHAMSSVYGDERPLGSVSIGPKATWRTHPASLDLPAVASPMILSSEGDLEPVLSTTCDKCGHWSGLHDRKDNTDVNYWGQVVEGVIPTNSMDEHILKDIRSRSGSPNDTLFERIHDTYRSVSRTLATDITKVIQNSPGIFHPSVVPAYWNSHASYKYFQCDALYNQGVRDYADLALKLLTSNTCTAVHLAWGDLLHDDHGSLDHRIHFKSQVKLFEQIGRMIAYMDMLPGSEGGSLLDETLVMVSSEFNRNWPKSGFNDHWVWDSVAFAGGQNLHGNRMVGGFDTEGKSITSPGFAGVPVDIIDENGFKKNRLLKRMDITHTALHLMGTPNTFLPGGPGQIVGVQKGVS